MRGIVYGVGVGPGDSELMTLKAVRLIRENIRENDVFAVPGKEPKESVVKRYAIWSYNERHIIRSTRSAPQEIQHERNRKTTGRSKTENDDSHDWNRPLAGVGQRAVEIYILEK